MTTGHHVWAVRYDRVQEDLFAIQDDLTDGIVAALETAVGRAQGERARRKPPGNLDAWDSTMRGWWHFQRFTREVFAAAIPLFRRAPELDASSAPARDGIAMVRLCAVQHARAAPAATWRVASGTVNIIYTFRI